MLFNDLSDDEFLKIADLHIETLNYALRDIPEEKVRVHICWGNYEGPHSVSAHYVYKALQSLGD